MTFAKSQNHKVFNTINEIQDLKNSSTRQRLSFLEDVARSIKAEDLVIYDLRVGNYLSDFAIVCSGLSTAHVNGIAEKILENAKKIKISPLGSEGFDEKTWILLDFGSVIIHIFEIDRRSEVNIDELLDERIKLEN